MTKKMDKSLFRVSGIMPVEPSVTFDIVRGASAVRNTSLKGRALSVTYTRLIKLIRTCGTKIEAIVLNAPDHQRHLRMRPSLPRVRVNVPISCEALFSVTLRVISSPLIVPE